MDVKAVAGAIQKSDADAIIVNLFEDISPGGATKAVDNALDVAISDLIEGGDFNGKAGQVAVLYPHPALEIDRDGVNPHARPKLIRYEITNPWPEKAQVMIADHEGDGVMWRRTKSGQGLEDRAVSLHDSPGAHEGRGRGEEFGP